AGAPIDRIGTSDSAEFVLQERSSGAAPSGWGWADNGWGVAGPPVFFAASGSPTVRIQQRENGAIVHQIVFSAYPSPTTGPGPRLKDQTILPSTDGSPLPPPPSAGTRVLWPGTLPAAVLVGNWRPLDGQAAAGGVALMNPDAGQPKIAPALASPANYFDMTFNAS